ncbi:hypothetical protein L3Q82_016185 [Scortum barcoo]|uniref:Uncharacterized protein n=1 Tax=Scortum barcoo TaxID=214431 RepID=A0ACB8VQJ9_9TELE|nr:hypothetical protein L3Q82_016185 [Scortum barcoo]
MSLGWPGNALGSPRKSWRKCLGPLYQSAGGAVEGHLGGSGGLMGCAAAGVGALSAVSELVGPSAEAALVNEPNGAR